MSLPTPPHQIFTFTLPYLAVFQLTRYLLLSFTLRNTSTNKEETAIEQYIPVCQNALLQPCWATITFMTSARRPEGLVASYYHILLNGMICCKHSSIYPWLRPFDFFHNTFYSIVMPTISSKSVVLISAIWHEKIENHAFPRSFNTIS